VRFLVFAPTGGFRGLSSFCIHSRAAQLRRIADARLLGFGAQAEADKVGNYITTINFLVALQTL